MVVYDAMNKNYVDVVADNYHIAPISTNIFNTEFGKKLSDAFPSVEFVGGEWFELGNGYFIELRTPSDYIHDTYTVAIVLNSRANVTDIRSTHIERHKAIMKYKDQIEDIKERIADLMDCSID